MTNPNEFSPDDVLERSLAEMRQQALPDGPPDALVVRTFEALQSAENEEPAALKLQPQGNKTMKFMMKVAAMIALVSGVAALIFIASRTSSMALADVVDKMREAHTLSYTASVTNLADPTKPVEMKMYINKNGRSRIEMPQGGVMIMDHTLGKSLIFNVTTKQATVTNLGGHRPQRDGTWNNWLEKLKDLDAKNTQSLGDREIDGRKARGFIVEKDGLKIRVWADAETKDPIQVEVDIAQAGANQTVTMTNFVLDANYDDALFSLDPPPGFAVRKVDMSRAINQAEDKTPEELMTAVLKFYADHSNGTFPAKFDDWSAYGKVMKIDAQNAESSDIAADMGTLLPFMGKLGKNHWGYRADSVRLGDKDKLILWYLDPKTNKYRGIFGDLRAREIQEKELEPARLWKQEPTTKP